MSTPATLSIYSIRLDFTEPMLGTAPSNPEVYADFIASKRFANEKKIATTPEELAAVEAKEIELTKEELAELPPENKGVTVFRRSPNGGLMLTDHMIRGYLKEAAQAMGDTNGKTWGLTSKIDRWIFITDKTGRPIRQLPIMRDGSQVMAPDSMLQRPLRAQTAQGPRVTLASSEMVNAPSYIEFYVTVLPLAEGEKHKLDEQTLKSFFSYGMYSGAGQWRSGGYGRFDATVTKQ
jgi:hypothetical protein